MIYFDLTKTAAARHRSGLTRVARRLQEELGGDVHPVEWGKWDRIVRPQDWFLTAELFSEAERPGWTPWLESRACRTAAIFHDAIPLQLPHVTWPQSVARHPGYLKQLAQFDQVLAISETSRRVLEGFWRWQQVSPRARLSVISLGSDFDRAPRVTAVPAVSPPPSLVCVGIIEPRKNQLFLVHVCRDLWDAGLTFDLHVVGRVNQHYGRPIERALRAAGRRYPGCHFHEAGDDQLLAGLLTQARALVFPTVAEGCGLPVLEGLWRGLPVVCTDLPVLRENAAEGGCLMLPSGDDAAWAKGLRHILTDTEAWPQLAAQARARSLPTWQGCARQILQALA